MFSSVALVNVPGVSSEIPPTATEVWLTEDQWYLLLGCLLVLVLVNVASLVHGWRHG
jgi:hypothetical protein